MTEINPLVWFSEREVNFLPKHFIKAPTPASTQSIFWVKSMLVGRFSIQTEFSSHVIMLDQQSIYFEDPAELTIYELRWSGTNI